MLADTVLAGEAQLSTAAGKPVQNLKENVQKDEFFPHSWTHTTKCLDVFQDQAGRVPTSVKFSLYRLSIQIVYLGDKPTFQVFSFRH